MTSLDRRLARVRAVVMDVDGVLTDAGMYYAPSGDLLKKFNTRDGMGLALLRRCGVRIAWISGEKSPLIRARARKLKVRDLFLGSEAKGRDLERFLRKSGIRAEETVYIGDDLNDLPAMTRAGIPVAVRDAAPEVIRASVWRTQRKGGCGAVREVADRIMKAKLINPVKYFSK